MLILASNTVKLPTGKGFRLREFFWRKYDFPSRIPPDIIDNSSSILLLPHSTWPLLYVRYARYAQHIVY